MRHIIGVCAYDLFWELLDDVRNCRGLYVGYPCRIVSLRHIMRAAMPAFVSKKNAGVGIPHEMVSQSYQPYGKP